MTGAGLTTAITLAGRPYDPLHHGAPQRVTAGQRRPPAYGVAPASAQTVTVWGPTSCGP